MKVADCTADHVGLSDRAHLKKEAFVSSINEGFYDWWAIEDLNL